ncbi:class II myosin [Aspergillus fumigatus]|jgi:myosin protein heavy chain
MLPSQLNVSPKRANPCGRSTPSPLPSAPQTRSPRPKSAIVTSPSKFEEARSHFRNSASISQLSPSSLKRTVTRQRSTSLRNDATSGTFAPEFIKSEELQRGADEIRGLEGDNDFSGNKYVWLRHPEKAFIRGLVLEERTDGKLLVQSDDGEVWQLEVHRVHEENEAYRHNSNERLKRTKSIRSIRRSLTKPMIWQNSRI